MFFVFTAAPLTATQAEHAIDEDTPSSKNKSWRAESNRVEPDRRETLHPLILDINNKNVLRFHSDFCDTKTSKDN